MKFELNDDKRHLSDDEIIIDIRMVSERLDNDYITISQYRRYGKYSQTAIQGHFGSWKNALAKAGLRTERTRDELKIISDEEYYADLKRVANLVGKDTVSYDDYQKHGKYSCQYVFKRFGKWNDALEKAGLKKTGFSKERVTEQQCFDEIERIWTLLGRQPTTTDITKSKISIYSIDTFKRRFGGWRNALESFVEYINATDKTDDSTTIYENNNDHFQVDTSQQANNEQQNDANVDVDSLNSVVPHRSSRNINTRLRFKVLQRDNFKCCACGASPAKDPSVVLHVDHIIPWSKGGETVLENLQTLCSKCNLGKGNMV